MGHDRANVQRQKGRVKLEKVAYAGKALFAHVGVIMSRVRENLHERQAPAVNLLAGSIDGNRLLLKVELS